MENLVLGILTTRCGSPNDFIKQLYQTERINYISLFKIYI